MNIKSYFKNFHQQESAATSVEYAIMIGLIIVVCIAGITSVGGETLETWNSNSDQISDAMNN